MRNLSRSLGSDCASEQKKSVVIFCDRMDADIIFGRKMKKLLVSTDDSHQLQNSQTKVANKVLYKCLKERNSCIRREVGNLIKNEIGIFFATKKLQKQLEDHNKNVIFSTPESPIQRVKKFRNKEK